MLRSVGFRVLALAVGLCLSLLVAEAALRLIPGAGESRAEASVMRDARRASGQIPRYVDCHCPSLYTNNPEHAEISSQGLRDRKFRLSKQPGSLRVLVLGDSVSYGTGLAPRASYPKLLEAALRKQFRSLEVINAGHEGYSPYNEWMWYRDRGRSFEPDVVITQLCLNDLVNPWLHSRWTAEIVSQIPAAAVPNRAHDRAVRARESGHSYLRQLKLYWKLRDWLGSEKSWRTHDEEGWPVFLTLEDSVSIDVWLDYDSPEWNWLRSTLDALHADVVADGAEHVLFMAPLAYQLKPGYPYDPQAQLRRYCAERGLTCVDPLKSFRSEPAGKLFRDGDSWHFDKLGHRLAALELLPVVALALERAVAKTRADAQREREE